MARGFTLKVLLTCLVVMLTFSVSVVCATSETDWWPTFHHDPAHTGYSDSTAPETNNIIWSYQTGWRVWSPPTVAEGRVYAGSWDCNVYCLDAYTGSKVWNYTTGAIVDSSPAVAEGRVYFGSYDYNVYCLDADTGTKIWNYTTGNEVRSSPAVADGRVYVGSWDCNVYCLDADNGLKIWSYQTGSVVVSSPAITDGKMYVGSGDCNVYCLDADNGSKIWSFHTGNAVWSSPSVVDGKVYVGSWDHNVYCLDADTGSEIWSYQTGNDVWSSPAVADGRVYVGSYDYNVYCLDADNGSKIWNYTTGNYVWSSPAVADGKVYVGSGDYNVYCLDADIGSEIWSYQTGNAVRSSPVWSSPAVADGIVYVGSYDGIVYAFGAHLRAHYLVTFSEQGLPNGTRWAVTFGGQTQSSTGSIITFSTTTSGSYNWNVSSQISVGSGERYVSDVTSGTVELASQNASQTIEYTHQYSLTITAQPSGSISYSYPESSGTVSGGSTEVIYVPAGGSVLLSAQPSSFLYQFNGWTGTVASTNSQLSVSVDSPMSVESTFGLNYMSIELIAAIVIIAILAGSFLARKKRKHNKQTK